jgi:hypothetical protein
MRPTRSVLLLPLSLCAACWDVGEGGDAHVPGTALGAYRVVGRLEGSSCGAGAADAPETWEFAVKLSRMGDELFWLNGREVIPGRIAADGVSFAFDTRVELELQAAGRGHPGCTMVRSDQASGKLSSATLDVPAFTGRLRFTYAPAPPSDCSGLLGVTGGFERLPCDVTYALDASRVTSPDSQ